MSEIKTFFLRITSRCNLDCEYCYVFKHQDQSWKHYPKAISRKNLQLFSSRLKEYVTKTSIDNILVVFHGGEPLLFGSDALIGVVDWLREELRPFASLEFSIQTNGLLLDKKSLIEFSKRKIQVSVSVDGPALYHDRFRKDKNGNGSHGRVMTGLRLLKGFPDIFSGIITVINPQMKPKELFDFYSDNDFLNTELLLPDANYKSPPRGRQQNPDFYKNWLLDAFSEWFARYQKITIRSFEHVLQAVAGLEVSTDFFGEGKLSYLTIETDGSYHTSDILKTTYQGASEIGLHMNNSSIMEALESEAVTHYNSYLDRSALSEICQKCEEVDICAGGCLPHRYGEDSKYKNPTVYCREMKALIKHARNVIESEIK